MVREISVDLSLWAFVKYMDDNTAVECHSMDFSGIYGAKATVSLGTITLGFRLQRMAGNVKMRAHHEAEVDHKSATESAREGCSVEAVAFQPCARRCRSL